MNYGIDFLGAARYQKTVLAEQPRSFGFGVFADVDGFGKAYKLIEQVAALGVPFIRVQLMWKDDHNFRPSDLPEIAKRCKLLKPIIEKHKSVKWYISPCCEHNLKESEWVKFAAEVNQVLETSVLIVNSPNKGKGFVSKAFINEYHHEDKPRSGGRYAFSFDGANQVDSDIEKYKASYKDAEYFMLWNSQCNLRRNLEDKTPRKDRKYWPTPKQIDSWIFQTKDRGEVNVPKGIFKSHSDQHTVPPSGKDQKPVYIISQKVNEIVLKADNGQTVGTLRYFGTFTGGGYRYYASEWGMDLAIKAVRLHGKAVCSIFINNKKVGTINPAYRGGTFR